MNKILLHTTYCFILIVLLFPVVTFGVGQTKVAAVLNPQVSPTPWQSSGGVISPFKKAQCGDGILQVGEDCEPPNSQVEIGVCSGGIKVKECKSDCSFGKEKCVPTGECGNGVIEGGEKCDDGALNGTYGHCDKGCTGLASVGYCGNGAVDKDANGNPLEACDTSGGVCTSAQGKKGTEPCSVYATSTLNSCAPDCQTRGNYCGDGEVDLGSPEECDDGNREDGDGCSANCKKEGQTKQRSDQPGICGNGIINKGEKCDQGERNGKKCKPKYGQRCTYCSADCQKIFTVDTSAFCGNSQIDQFGTDEKGKPLYEVCDVNNQGQTLAPFGYRSKNKGWITTEIAFVLDDTASMGPYIENLKQNVKSFLDNQVSASAGVVTFKDSAEMDMQFSTDFNKVKETISSIRPAGGGDFVECVSCGISTAMNKLNWHPRTKKIIIVASLDGAKKCDQLRNKLANEAIQRSIKIYTATKNAYRGCEDELKKVLPNKTNGMNFKLEADWKNTLGQISEDIGDRIAKPISCADKGKYKCQKQCTSLVNNCVNCGEYKSRESVPTLAILNPMIAGGESGYYSGSGKAYKWGTNDDDSINGGDRGDPIPGEDTHQKAKPAGTAFSVYRPNPPEGGVPGRTVGYISFANPSSIGQCNPDGCQYHNPAKYKSIISDSNNKPRNDKSLESDKLCDGEYGFFFNKRAIERGANTTIDIDQLDKNNGVGPYGDLFEYPVKGETGQIKNSVVVSPAVQSEEIRIVVKWTDTEGKKFGKDNPGKFTGSIYTQELSQGKIIDYSKAKKDNKICSDMEIDKIESRGGEVWGSWQPNEKTCNPYNKSGSAITLSGNVAEDLYVHNIGSTETGDKSIHSMTMRPLGISKLRDGQQIAFFVRALGKPIQTFQGGNLEVSIYTSQEKQEPLYSIYKPTFKFQIKQSQHSKNPLAPYWHAFNIKKVTSTYTYTRSGIEVTECKIGFVITDTEGQPIQPPGRDNPTSLRSHGKIITRFSDIKASADSIVETNKDLKWAVWSFTQRQC